MKPLFDDMLHASMLQMELRSESIDVTLQLEVKYRMSRYIQYQHFNWR